MSVTIMLKLSKYFVKSRVWYYNFITLLEAKIKSIVIDTVYLLHQQNTEKYTPMNIHATKKKVLHQQVIIVYPYDYQTPISSNTCLMF